ncbi:MAG: methyltransferase domain-containing protein [Pseudomonadota bacterium]
MDKTRVQQQFGANAANYATSPVHAKGKSLSRLVDLISPKSDWKALDVATGAGHTALAFAPHVASVAASDVTPEMLDQAKQLAAARELTNVTCVSADAHALPFPDDTFDLVTCRTAPHHFEDVSKFVTEVARVLKPGGQFGLVDNISADGQTNPDDSADDQRAAADAYNAFEKRRDPSHGRALGHNEWMSILADADLTVESWEHLIKPMSFNRWCDTMSVEAPVRDELRDMLSSGPAGFVAFLKPEFTNEDISFALTELLLVARR